MVGVLQVGFLLISTFADSDIWRPEQFSFIIETFAGRLEHFFFLIATFACLDICCLDICQSGHLPVWTFACQIYNFQAKYISTPLGRRHLFPIPHGIGEQGGGSGGVLPRLKKKFMTPLQDSKWPPPPQKWLLTPYKILSWRLFFRKDVKKISPAYAATSSWPKRAKTAIKKLAWDPPDPLCFNFLWPPLAKKYFDPPLEMTTLLTYASRASIQ